MHSGNNYSAKEVLFWTRRDIYALLIICTIPTALYVHLDWKWLALPWLPIALLGTAVAFVVGFKNNASYDRTWEARKVWGAIVNSSRTWGIMVKDYVSNKHALKPLSADELKQVHQKLYNRHFAWLTALRYQLREPRQWEAIYKAHNAEYKNKWFTIEEHANKLEDALKPYLSNEEYKIVMSKSNKATQIIALQSAHLKELLELGLIEDFRHMDLQKVLAEFLNNQGASERIKNFPYPRQYATLNLWFIKLFVFLLPLGMLQEFDKLGDYYVWLTVPFSVLSGWVFTTMEKIGEASENPFEGSANDVPITSISRTIEIDLREMLNESSVPSPLKPVNNILS
ncbi:MAG: multidrug transporter [Bacteroidia bacterium]|nr:multidrug transporter [Bacteroidia bacterium]